jgi:CBS domain-containing protein
VAITARDIMARSEATLSPEMDIFGAMKLLLQKKLTGAPVVDETGKLLGMLTERDCLNVLVGGALEARPGGTVDMYMSTPAQSIQPTASLYDIVHVFVTRPYRKLPVVDDQGRVVGQVSRRDTLLAFDSSDDLRLDGTATVRAPDGTGVDSAMRLARGKR